MEKPCKFKFLLVLLHWRWELLEKKCYEKNLYWKELRSLKVNVQHSMKHFIRKRRSKARRLRRSKSSQ
jgi:hypothetical protein